MKKSFLTGGAPFLCEMVQVPTAAQAEKSIKRAVAGGATAIGLQLGNLQKSERTKQALCGIFAAAGDLPVYVTNYRNFFNEGMTDDELMDGLLFALDCGATLLDVMGDTFDPAPEELTTNTAAIEKQMRFIDEVHRRGGEVLMSSHVKEYRSAERVLEIAKEQQRRGADIVKIVTGAETEEEQLENLRVCNLLKKELDVPFLFLSGGKCNYLHRTLGPAFGVNMWLCFTEYDETTYVGPPLLKDVLNLKTALKL